MNIKKGKMKEEYNYKNKKHDSINSEKQINEIQNENSNELYEENSLILNYNNIDKNQNQITNKYQELDQRNIKNLENNNNDDIIFHDDINKIINDRGYNLVTFKIILFAFIYVFLEGYKLSYYSKKISKIL
jgi:hypothetical protein